MVTDPYVSNTGSVPGSRYDILKTDGVSSWVHQGFAHPYPTLSDRPTDNSMTTSDVLHRALKSQEDGSDRYLTVSMASLVRQRVATHR